MTMTTRSIPSIFRPAALRALIPLAGALLLASCSTPGIERSARARASMRTVEADLNQAIQQVEATSSSLENLIRPGQSDPKSALEDYSANVTKMDQRGRELVKHTDEMNDRRRDYFEEWKKEGNSYSNAEIRDLSAQRRTELSITFARIPAASAGIKNAFKTYQSDIREIQLYLSNDLTPKGIESITTAALKSMRDGDHLKEAVKPVLVAIDQARAEMARGGAK